MIKKSLLFFAFIAMSVAAMAQADTTMFPLPKDYPKYPAGKEALNAFIQQNIVYPEYEKSMGIEGTVVVGCDVELDGTLSNFRIESTVEGSVGFDAEAIRVCQKLGKFTPCLRNGKPLAFDTDIYVKFDLNNGDEMEMAIAKLSKKELKEIEKDAKWFCDYLAKTTDAQVVGDEEKHAKLTSKYHKELDALEDKYPGKSPKSVQFERLTKPCMDDMFKRMGIVDVDGDGLYTQEEAELTPKELKQIEKDAKVICKIMNEMVTDMLKAQKVGDMERIAAIAKEYDPKLSKIYKTYLEGSKAQQRLAEVIKPCLEDAWNRVETAIKK
jgi:TonB family protein